MTNLADLASVRLERAVTTFFFLPPLLIGTLSDGNTLRCSILKAGIAIFQINLKTVFETLSDGHTAQHSTQTNQVDNNIFNSVFLLQTENNPR